MQKGDIMDIIFKCPAVAFCIFLLGGIIIAYLSNSILVISGLAFLFICCLFSFRGLRSRGLFVPVGMILFFLFGAFHFLYINHVRLEAFDVYDGQFVEVKGCIASEPEVKGEKVSYHVKTESIRRGKSGEYEKINGKILLTTLREADGYLLNYGDEIKFAGTLYQPRGMRNPGGFDYRRYLATKGVGATIFSYPYAIEKEGERYGNFAVRLGIALRNRIVQVIEQSLPRQQAGLLNGILIGYRKGLPQEVQEAFNSAGLTHIMAVSGANISFIILPAAYILKKLKIRKRAANAALMLLIVLFVLITGFEPSVSRAAVMACILLTGKLLFREPDVTSSIAISCIVLLSVNPCMLFDVGFQLSYAATVSIVLLYKNVKALLDKYSFPKWVRETLAATISAQFGVLPVTVLYFNRVSLVSVISNLLAVPMLGLITVLGMIMAVVGQFSLLMSRIIGYANSVFLSAVLYITKFTSAIPYSSVRTITPSMIFVIVYYIFIWYVFRYRPAVKSGEIRRNINTGQVFQEQMKPGKINPGQMNQGQIELEQLKPGKLKPDLKYLNLKYAAIAVTVAAILLVPGFIKPRELQITFLDVGQGDSAFIRTYSGKTVLIDGGGSNNPEHQSGTGEKVLIPYLLDEGVMKLDAVIASHSHSDHTEGLFDVLEHLKVKMLIIPYLSDETCFRKLIDAAEDKGVPVARCYEGAVIRLDDRTFMEVLNPPSDVSYDLDSLNNTSLVLRLCYDGTSVLFTGDAEAEAEERMLAGGREISSDVIKIAHHGSESSTGEDFLGKVSPKAAVISVGRNNFGHPSDAVLDLLEEKGILCLRTDQCGAISLKSDGKRIKIKRTVPESELDR